MPERRNGTQAAWNGIATHATRDINAEVARLMRSGAFPEADRGDLEQELALDLLLRLPRFDRRKASRRTFASRIIERKARNLVRGRFRYLRGPGRNACSLADLVPDREGRPVERVELLSTNGPVASSSPNATDLAMDVTPVVSQLPERLQNLCALLQDKNPSDAARELGIPRSTLASQMHRVRDRFVAAGLEAYSPSRSFSRRSSGTERRNPDAVA